jgi:O-antigen/teichoic acid export membrane protein
MLVERSFMALHSSSKAGSLIEAPTTAGNTEISGTDQFRSQVGNIGRHSGAFFAGTIFTAALGYGFKVYLARTLGPEVLGIYALGMTLIGLAGVFNGLGLAQSGVRFAAAYLAANKLQQLHALLWRAPLILLVVNVLLAGILLLCDRWIAVGFYHAPKLVGYLPWFALIMLFGVISGFYGKVLEGYRDVRRRTLIVSFVGSPLTIVVAVVLITKGRGLHGYLLAQILSSIVVCLLLVSAVRKLTPGGARFSAHVGGSLDNEVWSFSTSMLGIGFLEFVMVQADKVSLGFYRGAKEVGIYSVAAALVVYVPLVLSSVNQIFSPTIADLWTRGQRPLLARLFQSLTKWILGLTLPLAAVMIVFARPLMGIFGPDFERGWPVLVIGTLGQLVNCGVGSAGFLLLMSGNQNRLIRVQAGMATVMVLLSIMLVPLWGAVGAAAAAALTNVGMNLWNLFEVRKALGLSPYNRSYLRLLLPTVAMLATTLLLKEESALFRHAWLALVASLVVAYVVFGVATLMSGLNSDDRLIADAIWSRVSGGFSRTSGVRS